MTDDTVSPVVFRSLQRPSDESIQQFYRAMGTCWQPVLRSADLVADGVAGRVSGRVAGEETCETADFGANAMRSVTLLDKPLVIARLDGKLTALLDVCRHFQARLSLGEITSVNGQAAIQCPYHGWAYAPDGQCVRIPQLAADRRIPETVSVPTFQVTEALGLIWVCMADEPVFDIPLFDEFHQSAFRITTLDEQTLTHTSSPRMIMATLDDTHFPWVHEGILGTRDQPQAPDHTVTRDGSTLKVSYTTEQPASLASGATAGDHPVTIHYDNSVHMPNVIKLKKTTPTGRYIIWLATCPVDYCHTRSFWTFARDYDTDPSHDAAYESFSAHVRSQDKPIIESQQPWLLPPFWTKIELPQAGIDEPLIQYQRWLQELGVVIDV